jgi:hypothetical protein
MKIMVDDINQQLTTFRKHASDGFAAINEKWSILVNQKLLLIKDLKN